MPPWTLQKNRGLDVQHPGEPFHDVQARRIDAAFERAQIGPVDFGFMRQSLLRQPAGAPLGLQVAGKDLSQSHGPKDNGLQDI